jgi:hypothetical protein
MNKYDEDTVSELYYAILHTLSNENKEVFVQLAHDRDRESPLEQTMRMVKLFHEIVCAPDGQGKLDKLG